MTFLYKILNLLLLLSVLSCSSLRVQDSSDRGPASISSVVSNCFNIVSSFFNRPIDYDSLLSKLNTNESLSYREYRFISKYTVYIENPNEKRRLIHKISKKLPLSSKDMGVINRFIKPQIYKDKLASSWSYRKRYIGGETSLPITYGLEVELLLKDNPKVVNFYKVDGYDDDTWLAKTIDERLMIAQRAIDDADAYEEAFVKIPGGHASLPDTIFVEGHKTIEANGIIFNTIGETEDFLKWFSDHIGRGSFQGHVAYHNYARIKGVAGYISFESDLAQLDNLERGYNRYLKNSNITPSKSLVHHSLGPLSEDERLLFLNYESSINNKIEVTEKIGKAKTILGPNFRVGYPYPKGMVGYEHRQYHKRYEQLIEGMDYQSRELEVFGDLQRYEPFGEVTQIEDDLLEARIKELGLSVDTETMQYMFISIGETIEKKANSYGMALGGASGDKRFFFPLKDWGNHPLVKKMDKTTRRETLNRIKYATKSYIESVNKLSENIDLDNIDPAVIGKLQVLNAKWGDEVKLSSIFQNYRKKIMSEINSRGPPEFHSTPKLTQMSPQRSVKFENGKSVDVYNVTRKVTNTLEYNTIKESSVEILYDQTMSQYGHIQLRVGNKKYAFNMQRDTLNKDIQKRDYTEKSNIKGYVYLLSQDQIEKVTKDLDHFYKSSEKYNIPPFDTFGKKLEIKKSGLGTYEIIRPSKYGKGIQNKVKGKLITLGQAKFLEAPNGVKVPILEEEGKIYIQGYNCASSAHHVLKEYLGVELDSFLGADTVKSKMESGTMSSAPDYMFEY